jgi:hypothetical protein
MRGVKREGSSIEILALYAWLLFDILLGWVPLRIMSIVFV